MTKTFTYASAKALIIGQARVILVCHSSQTTYHVQIPHSVETIWAYIVTLAVQIDACVIRLIISLSAVVSKIV
jgi:hypothetical protein